MTVMICNTDRTSLAECQRSSYAHILSLTTDHFRILFVLHNHLYIVPQKKQLLIESLKYHVMPSYLRCTYQCVFIRLEHLIWHQCFHLFAFISFMTKTLTHSCFENQITLTTVQDGVTYIGKRMYIGKRNHEVL